MRNYAEELEAAMRIARRAGEAALAHSGCAFESKPDASPVTIADRECERIIAAALEEAFPADGILGEEGSAKRGASGRRWIVDPIDGTRDFIRGIPSWAVLIALEDAGEVAAGCAFFPATNEMFSAARGAGAFLNGGRIRVSGVRSPAEAVLCLNAFNQVAAFPWAPRLNEWMSGFWSVRSFGGARDAVSLAAGRVDAWIETSGKPWDFAAFRVIAEEAGARFFNFDGGATIYGGNCVMCVPALEAATRRFLGCDNIGA